MSATAPAEVLAAGNSLSDGSTSPGSGTTDTVFQFSVTYSSPRGFAATRVVAHVANQVIDMALVAGTAEDGVYQAAGQLPEGSWPVTFEATAVQGRSPTLAGPTVIVSSVSVATPPPPPAPVPVVPEPPAPPAVTPEAPPVAPAAPAEAPIADPTAGATSSATSSSRASAAGVVVGTPGGETQPAASVDDGLPWTLGFVVTVVIGIVLLAPWLLALARRRRAAETEPRAAHAYNAQPPPSTPAQPARRLADWELSALDDEPIGTVEYLGRQL